MAYERATRHETKVKALAEGEKWFNAHANPVNGATYRVYPVNYELQEGETFLEVKYYGND